LKVDLAKALEEARTSAWSMRKLNFMLAIGIPFNSPHGIRVHEIVDDSVTTTIPYRRKNLNHIKGIHACGLATAAEFCSGLVLLRRLSSKKYRLIMQKLEVEYTYQAKSSAFAKFELSDKIFQSDILKPLEENGQVYFQCAILVHDVDGNLLCKAYTNWQIKAWDQVRTKQ
jgi:acyl-coenzyme A thioesterase PaaI-like protein